MMPIFGGSNKIHGEAVHTYPHTIGRVSMMIVHKSMDTDGIIGVHFIVDIVGRLIIHAHSYLLREVASVAAVPTTRGDAMGDRSSPVPGSFAPESPI